MIFFCNGLAKACNPTTELTPMLLPLYRVVFLRVHNRSERTDTTRCKRWVAVCASVSPTPTAWYIDSAMTFSEARSTSNNLFMVGRTPTPLSSWFSFIMPSRLFLCRFRVPVSWIAPVMVANVVFEIHQSPIRIMASICFLSGRFLNHS